jgi:hypothetical protein
MTLYHYCCEHSRKAIGTRGMLRPNRLPFGPYNVLWLTPQAIPDRKGLGLTSSILNCDRLDYRYRVQTDAALLYHEWADRVRLSSYIRAALEGVDGARPELWYVSLTSQLGILDRSYQKAQTA